VIGGGTAKEKYPYRTNFWRGRGLFGRYQFSRLEYGPDIAVQDNIRFATDNKYFFCNTGFFMRKFSSDLFINL